MSSTYARAMKELESFRSAAVRTVEGIQTKEDVGLFAARLESTVNSVMLQMGAHSCPRHNAETANWVVFVFGMLAKVFVSSSTDGLSPVEMRDKVLAHIETYCGALREQYAAIRDKFAETGEEEAAQDPPDVHDLVEKLKRENPGVKVTIMSVDDLVEQFEDALGLREINDDNQEDDDAKKVH